MPKGQFIAIDGTDGSGKATQVKRLVERIRATGRPVDVLDFPRYGHDAAHFVEKYLRGEYGEAKNVGARRASIFYALDRYDDSMRIHSLLEQGVTLVTNRYVSANKGHQTSHLETQEERRAFLAWLNELEYGTFGIPKPDMTILLHVPADIGLKLAEERDRQGVKAGGSTDILQQAEHLRRAEQAYLELPELDDAEQWHVIECVEQGELQPIDAIHEKVWSLVEPILR